MHVVAFATQGPGSFDEDRIRTLLEGLQPAVVPFDRSARARGAIRLWRSLRRERPDVVVMEGTGLGGGLVLIGLRLVHGQRYVVSSGDAVGPYLATINGAAGLVGGLYERLLCRLSAGFIGWSPYLAGRALTFGAPRAMTAANWAEGSATEAEAAAVRERFGIPRDALVIGIVGSLRWSSRRGYCYGLELVRTARLVDRDDVRFLIVGDGDGRARLEAEAGDLLGSRVLLPGRVAREDVPAVLRAMDLGSLPQSTDGVGSFRYTTKISEYLAAGLPIVTGQLPLAYDVVDGHVWRLPGDAPWEDAYVEALAALLRDLTHDDVAGRRPHAVPAAFDREGQQRAAAAFVRDVGSR